jgi:hypothetical protein
MDDRLEYLMKQVLVVPQRLQPTLASRPSSGNKLCISRPEGHSNAVYQTSASKTKNTANGYEAPQDERSWKCWYRKRRDKSRSHTGPTQR